MMRKRLIALAFTTHALLGNFCMMSMAHAEEMQMPPVANEVMNMSADCEHCLHGEHQGIDAESQKSPCDNGHCLSSSASSGEVSSFAFSATTITVPTSAVAFTTPIQQAIGRPLSQAPPGPPVSTKTIVLLL